FLTGHQAASVSLQEGRIGGIVLDDGSLIEADNVIIAASPAVAHKLVPHADSTSLKRWKEQAMEVTSACLDVALRKLPKPKQQFIYGIDTPVFLTNQSRAAR